MTVRELGRAMSKNNALPPELLDLQPPSGLDALEISYGRDILVVDDNQSNLVAIEAALAPLGRKLVLAHSGIEALGKLLEQDFALIILDVAMPGMDGFETAKMVRARDRNRATPIIFVTGMSWQDDAVIRGYELGAFDFLMKP
ncbi:MAG: Chemotaxis regulator - transmits chemoreceptor signals to flagelllar motor component CheY, partial [Deltaproteobacteria bacterium]|nr:Chemotaxis regulator - transmits chemoreceptor signals to flagelllar motor component CheY [Deltaproteobacteria bacterium]